MLGLSTASCNNTASSTNNKDDTTAPEGTIHGAFSLTHDFRGRQRYITAEQGAVASDHGRCGDQGIEVLQEGGNAVDASVVVALCQGLYNPMASGLGGGHIMVIRCEYPCSSVQSLCNSLR